MAHEGISSYTSAAATVGLLVQVLCPSDMCCLLLLQLLAEVDEDTLEKLREAVDNIKEPIFQYDRTYVYDCMEWGPPVSTSAAPGGLTWTRLRVAILQH